MLKEGSTPMATHKTDAEAVLLRREVDGDEGEDIRREMVYGNERVLPFANAVETSRSICETSSRVKLDSESACRATQTSLRDVRRRVCRVLQLLV